LRAVAKDGRPHGFQFRYGMDGAMVRNVDTYPVAATVSKVEGLAAVRIGRVEQNPLAYAGDRARCDWGYAWLAAGGDARAEAGADSASLCFAAEGVVEMERHLLLAYEDLESVVFFNRRLKAWWARAGLPFTGMLASAAQDYGAVMKKIEAFDAEFARDLERAGGADYARLAGFAYRPSFAACKLVADPNGQPLYFSKENAGGGYMGSVGVSYRQVPQLALMNPTLLRAALAPILLYADSEAWSSPFAPHDVGLYPIGNREGRNADWKKKQESPGGKQMQLETCGDMLICLGILSEIEDNADFAAQWWPLVTRWAEYLAQQTGDAKNPLFADTFAAPLAVKATMALACYAKMARMRGYAATSAKYLELAKGMAPKWMDAVKGTFDKPASRLMKCSLAWDKILGLHFRTEGLPRLSFGEEDFIGGENVNGILASPVMGGLYLPLLDDRHVWEKYAKRSSAKTRIYAPLALSDKQTVFNLASFNIRCPADKGEIAWSNRFPRVVKIIRDRGFDVFGVQEATPIQFKDLCGAFKSDFGYVGRGRSADGGGEGMFIFYRKAMFDCLADGTFQLSETPEVWGSRSWGSACPRTCTWAKLRDRRTGYTFLHFNTHLDHISREAKVKGMALIFRRMMLLAQGSTVFLTGDMNTVENPGVLKRWDASQTLEDIADDPDDNAITFAKKFLVDTKAISGTPHTGSVETFNGYTKPLVLIDYIFTDAGTRILSHATCDDMPGGKYASDHFPVMIRAVLGATPPARTVYSPVNLLRTISEKRVDVNVYPCGGKDRTAVPFDQSFVFENEILHVLGNGIGYVGTREKFQNYRAVIEFKWGERQWGSAKGRAFDSGVHFHANGPVGAVGGRWPASFQANVVEGGIGDLVTLSAKDRNGVQWRYRMDARATHEGKDNRQNDAAAYRTFDGYSQLSWKNRPPDWKHLAKQKYPGVPDRPHGEWNRLVITCKGDTVEVEVNGQKVNKAVNLIPSSGSLALQTEGSELFVRRFELLPL
ncbi:MAG: DUF4965 domain-containing protein, partial [Kiritimatiellae bacterium]|nr:DUF4965 domain-containing protein [Kiritimatiellia bacterium]